MWPCQLSPYSMAVTIEYDRPWLNCPIHGSYPLNNFPHQKIWNSCGWKLFKVVAWWELFRVVAWIVRNGVVRVGIVLERILDGWGSCPGPMLLSFQHCILWISVSYCKLLMAEEEGYLLYLTYQILAVVQIMVLKKLPCVTVTYSNCTWSYIGASILLTFCYFLESSGMIRPRHSKGVIYGGCRDVVLPTDLVMRRVKTGAKHEL